MEMVRASKLETLFSLTNIHHLIKNPKCKPPMDFFPIHFNTAIAGAFFVLLIFTYLSWRSRSINGRKHVPPEAGGAWPIIGHLHLLGETQLPHITLGSLADKYGPIFTIRLGVHTALVVSSSELAKQIFTTHDIVALSRPNFLAAKYLGYNYANFSFSPYGPYWRELRKVTSLELLSNRRLDLLKHVRISETQTFIQELYKLWNEKKNGSFSGRVLVDMKKLFGDLTLNVILRMVAGKRYCGDVVRSDEEEARRCRKTARDFFHLIGVFTVADAVPWLRWLDIGGYEKAMKMVAEEMDSILEGWLQEHRRKKATGESTGEYDFMDVMLLVVDGADLAGYDPDTAVKATCMVLISGGNDTTTVMLIWALSLLLNNRHALKKAQEELDMHIGKDRLVDEADIGKLLYLQAIVKETFRLYLATPLFAPREFAEDCILGGYQVSKGTRLILNLRKLQRDTDMWSDPSKFKPERFLTTHRQVDVKGHHFELIPFGAGRRICPAITFALQMIHLILANLLHAFEISTPFDEKIDMTESSGLTTIKAAPLDVLITPRLSSSLY